MSKNIFVYGSLMFPEIVEALTGEQIETIDAVLDGYKRYQIFDGDKSRSYPAIQKTKGRSVTGKILLNIDKEALKVLDFFEDVGYSRNIEQVLVSRDKFEVEVYTWPENPGKEIQGKLKGEWGEEQIEEFKENYLRYFMDELIPKTLEEYEVHKKGERR